jgi:fructose-specific phosphotransferase system IIA component
LDEISMAVPALADLKAELAGWRSSECKQLLADALNCATADDVEAILKNTVTRLAAPLIQPELILINEQATTKAEAIKLATDRLYVLGRTEDARQLEEAIWQREQNYSTGFGHGFAIPHCKSIAVRSNSLVLVKLKAPVDWDALDGKPVGVVILLALHERDGSNQHMKVLASLARHLMDESFRAQLERETDPHTLYELLKRKLEVE